MQASCSAFISFTETHPAARARCFPCVTRAQANESYCPSATKKSMLSIFVLRPESPCPGRLVPSGINCQSFVIMSRGRPRGSASVPLRAFILGFVKVALHLFDQVSCFVLFFPSFSKLSKNLYNSVSLFALSLQLLFQLRVHSPPSVCFVYHLCH